MDFGSGWIGQDYVVPAPKSRSHGRLTQSEDGESSVPKIPSPSLREICLAYDEEANLNTCGDPDCGNFGAAADFAVPRPMGRNAHALRAAFRSNSAMVGLGSYRLNSI